MSVEEDGLSVLLERSLRGCYEDVALIDEHRAYTFGELEQRSNQIARVLVARGLRPEDRVAICVPRSLDRVAAIVGVLAAGGAFVAIDVGHPAERIEFVLRDSGARYVLTTRALLERLPSTPEAIVLDELGPPNGDAPCIEGRMQRGDALAYVIYTSGSTGMPKPVGGTHRGAVNRIRWMLDAEPLAEDEVFFQKTSPSFVDSIWEILGPLVGGRPSVLASDAEQSDVERLLDRMASKNVTRIVLVPSLLSAMLDAAPDLGARVPTLRHVTSSGEALSASLARRLQAAAPRVRLINLYGASEAAADSTCSVVSPDVKTVRVGTPISGTAVYLLDRDLRPVPDGETGELFVSGVGLARGYLGRPGSTAERFLPDPLSPAPGRRMYRTGDLATRTSNGEIEIRGRVDHQVKIRGIRIELGEVETKLRECSGVQDVVVAVRDDAPGGRGLVAYVVLDRTKSNVASLRKALARQLPAGMLPASFTVLEALPRTPSGKVDRKALPKPDLGYVNTPSASGSAVPAALTKSWIEALKLPSAPPSSVPFVELGGHSLLLARLHKSLRDSGAQVPFGRLHGAMTLEDMHAAIEAHVSKNASKDAAGAEEEGVRAADEGDRVVGVTPGRAVLLAVLEVFAALLIASFALRCGLALLGPQVRTRALGQYGRVESLLRELPRVATEDDAVLVYGSSPATFGIAPEVVDAAFAANGRDVKCFNLGTPMLTPRSLGALATVTRDAFRRSGKRARLSVVELSPTLSDYESFAEMEALLLALVPLETSLPLVPTASAPMTFYHRAVIGLPPVAYRQLVDMTILEDSQWWWFTPQPPAPEEMLTQTVGSPGTELEFAL